MNAATRVLRALPPASGAAVMGTGIVSIDFTVDGSETLSRVLLVIATALWVGLGISVADRLLDDRPRAWREAGSPAALTGIAGTAVVGARVALLGWDIIGETLLALALLLWLVLMPPVARRWQTPTVGVSFVTVVSTESLAVLAAILAVRERIEWLAVAAIVALVLGLVFYVVVLARFDLRQLLAGRGDHWVAGGALAIATLACGRTAQAAEAMPSLARVRGVLETGSLALWAAAAAWLLPLIACEAVAPRIAYDARRWSTVFPVGMYAACSFVAGDVAGVGGLVDFARAWTWVALAVWLIVFAALFRRGIALWRGTLTSSP